MTGESFADKVSLVISDPENPKFDLEAWIKSKEAPA